MYTEWQFEWDQNKSLANARKHGISFEDARLMWDDPFIAIVPIYRSEEKRWVAIARIGRTCFTAIFTYRAERVRLISARKSTKKEVDIYEGHKR